MITGIVITCLLFGFAGGIAFMVMFYGERNHRHVTSEVARMRRQLEAQHAVDEAAERDGIDQRIADIRKSIHRGARLTDHRFSLDERAREAGL